MNRRRACYCLSVLVAILRPAEAGGYLDVEAGSEKLRFRPVVFAEAGVNLNRCPHLGVYYEFRRSWQAGLEIRSWIYQAETAFDAIPETDVHFRKLWLAAEDRQSLRNSEYVDLGVGFFPSRDFGYEEAGLKVQPSLGLQPHVRLTIGKYWMPWLNAPWGFDISLALGRYFNGHPPGFLRPDIITASVAVFYLFGASP